MKFSSTEILAAMEIIKKNMTLMVIVNNIFKTEETEKKY